MPDCKLINLFCKNWKLNQKIPSRISSNTIIFRMVLNACDLVYLMLDFVKTSETKCQMIRMTQGGTCRMPLYNKHKG